MLSIISHEKKKKTFQNVAHWHLKGLQYDVNGNKSQQNRTKNEDGSYCEKAYFYANVTILIHYLVLQ